MAWHEILMCQYCDSLKLRWLPIWWCTKSINYLLLQKTYMIMRLIAIFHWKMAWHKIMTSYFCIIEDARIELTFFCCSYHKTMGTELCSPLIYKFRPFHHFIWISNTKTNLYSAKISPHCSLSLSFQSVLVKSCFGQTIRWNDLWWRIKWHEYIV